MQSKIYMDNNATTSISKAVWEKMSYYVNLPLNPSSIHECGRDARKFIEEAKKQICNALNIEQKKYHIVFTGSGTEANNWVFNGLSSYIPVISNIEHLSVMQVENKEVIKIDANGLLNLNALEETLAKLNNEGKKVIVSIIYANNETGVIQPLEKIIEVARKYNALIHSDMIQAVGKIKVDFSKLDLDLFTISAHKINGPVGIAALFIKRGVPITPMLKGGGQNQGLRAGTENVISIMGMAEAISYSVGNLENYIKVTQDLRDYLEKEIRNFAHDAIFVNKDSLRLPNTSCIIMPNVGNELQLITFDMEKIMVSAGSACSSGKIAASHVLLANGFDENMAKCAIRVSLGINNNISEVEKFINTWKKIYISNIKKVS